MNAEDEAERRWPKCPEFDDLVFSEPVSRSREGLRSAFKLGAEWQDRVSAVRALGDAADALEAYPSGSWVIGWLRDRAREVERER